MRRGFINCQIYNSSATALLCEENQIVRLGTNEEIESLLDSEDECVDIQGMFLCPGFVDSHMHLLELGYYLSNVQLANCHLKESLVTKLENALKNLKEGEWLIGRGYLEESFSEDIHIDKALLDSISTEVPIVLTRGCGHVLVVNSKALELAGIQEDYDEEDGYIDVENGIVKENAIQYIHHAQPKPSIAQLEEYILKGSKYANACGITTVGSDDFLSITDSYKDPLDAFEKLSYQDRMTVRVNEQCEFENIQAFASFLDDGYTFDVGNDYFRIGPLKLIVDGSLGARTASLSRPYEDCPTVLGCKIIDDADMERDIMLANRFNMPTIAHCIGDDAVDHYLSVLKDNICEGNPLHHGIVHCQILRPDQIEKICDMKLSCYIQSLFIDSDASILEKRVGKERASTCYPFRTLMDGTLTSNGSDAPVEMPNVLKGIQLAVTRCSMTTPTASMNEKECMSVEQALDSYTVKGAEQIFMEDRIGEIKEGYYADFVILDKDITKISVSEIAEAHVMMTVCDGRTVFEK